MHFYSWKCTFIVSVKWLLEQHAYFSYLKYSYTSTSERKGGFAINQVQKESRLWLSKFLLVFTMIIWCKFSPACHRLDGEVSYLYITLWVCYAVVFAQRDFLVTPRTFPAHFCFAFSSSLIGFLEYLTYATDIFPRLSPLTCVLIGLLFCLDYATFFPCLSLWLAFSLRFDWFIGFFVGKAISFCLVLILRQTWLIDTKREAAKL